MKQEPYFSRPTESDWKEFLAVAEAEGWRVPAGEIDFFRGSLASAALALHCGGIFAGMVTFVDYGLSAWIGNLIVRPSLRGRGFGRMLFEKALCKLKEAGAASIWLTASEAGFPLYERRGFKTVGRVERWVLKIRPQGQGTEPDQEDEWGIVGELEKAFLLADAGVWGGRRLLLDRLLIAGRLFSCGEQLALLQREPGRRILGPWYGVCQPLVTRRMLAAVRAAAAFDEEVVTDILAGSMAPGSMEECGYVRCGDTRLMVLGDAGAIRLDNLVALASLGSMG